MQDFTPEALKEALHKYKQDHNLKVVPMAERLGISQGTMYKLLAGDVASPTKGTLRKLSPVIAYAGLEPCRVWQRFDCIDGFTYSTVTKYMGNVAESRYHIDGMEVRQDEYNQHFAESILNFQHSLEIEPTE